MKKTLFVTGLLALMLAFGMESAHAQIRLDDAIRNAAAGIAPQLGSDVQVAVVYMDAGSVAMSNYIRSRMDTALRGRFRMVTVQEHHLDIIRAEQDRQMDERFDTAAFVGITGGLGAQFIVVGTFQPILNFHDFRVQVINVGTNVIEGTFYAHVQDDRIIRELLGTDFTTTQRWSAVGLNFVPGLGSFVVMNDTFGGVFQLITGVAGWGLLAFNIGNIWQDIPNPLFPGSYVRETNTTAVIGTAAGGALIATQLVFNIVRSSTYTRPAARTASIANPYAWGLAIVPGGSGIEGVSLSLTTRF